MCPEDRHSRCRSKEALWLRRIANLERLSWTGSEVTSDLGPKARMLWTCGNDARSLFGYRGFDGSNSALDCLCESVKFRLND